MESIDKLREWSHHYDNAWVRKDGSIVLTTKNMHGVYYGENYGEAIRSMISAVEDEIAERYRELPVDADGVPIHIGDRMRLDNGHEGEVWLIGAFDIMMSDHVCFDWEMSHHVKPRTVEDVLRDFLDEKVYTSKTYERYADEIRELIKEVEL